MSNAVPLKRVAQIVAGQSPPSEVVSDVDGSQLPFLQGNAEFGQLHPEARLQCDVAPKKAEPGDILLSVRAPVGALNKADRSYGIGRGLCAIRPAANLDEGFAWWTATGITPHLAAVATGSTYDAVTADDVGALRIPLPPLVTQRAIADYLDRETARIDALIVAKRRMVDLLEERWQGILENRIRDLSERFGDTPLKHVCREVVVGIVITPSAWYADSGIPAIRGINVSAGNISFDDIVHLTPEGHALHRKSQLHAGDVVVVRTGQAGAAAVVPPALDGANCIDLVIIRLSKGYLPQFLEYVLNSDWMQKHIGEHSVGTIQAHFNVGAAGLVPVPLAPQGEQERAVRTMRGERKQVTDAIDALTRQTTLLQEHRQALITAAVTGQLDIPEAA